MNPTKEIDWSRKHKVISWKYRMKFLKKKVSCREGIDNSVNKYKKLSYKDMIYIPKKNHSTKRKWKMIYKISKIWLSQGKISLPKIVSEY
jgi:hypothetical protein